MVVRIHHCIADGIALSRVLLSLTDTHADAGIAPARDGAGRGLLGSIAAPVKTGARLAQAGVHEGIEILTHPTSSCRRSRRARLPTRRRWRSCC